MIYFDHAATSIYKPKGVERAMIEALRTQGNPGRGINEASLCAAGKVFEVREKLASFFHAQNPSRIAFTANSTESLNIAIKGLLDSGDHVITTVLEHNSVLRPLYEMSQQGVEVTYLTCDATGMIDYDQIEPEIKAHTKAIICTHASNLTGNVLDVKKIGEIAKKHQLMLIVDASQSAGFLDIDVVDMNIDILCFTGHKSLLGPQGVGGIYVREGVDLRPLKSGGSGVQTYLKTHPKQMPTALEAGTLNGPGIAGLGAGIDYLNETGLAAIREKELALMWRFYEGVKEIPGVKIYGNFDCEIRCPIVSLNIKDYDSSYVGDELFYSYDIANRSGAHCAPMMHEALGTKETGAIRFSFSFKNSDKEVDTAIEAIREIAL